MTDVTLFTYVYGFLIENRHRRNKPIYTPLQLSGVVYTHMSEYDQHQANLKTSLNDSVLIHHGAASTRLV